MNRATTFILAANDRWPHQSADEVESEIINSVQPGARWLLVEESRITGGYNLSTFVEFASLESEQVGQECAEDWDPVVAVDLITGEVHTLHRTYGLQREPARERLLEGR